MLTLEKQSVTKGDEADDMMDPGSLQWAGEIAASVYVAVPRVHGRGLHSSTSQLNLSRF